MTVDLFDSSIADRVKGRFILGGRLVVVGVGVWRESDRELLSSLLDELTHVFRSGDPEDICPFMQRMEKMPGISAVFMLVCFVGRFPALMVLGSEGPVGGRFLRGDPLTTADDKRVSAVAEELNSEWWLRSCSA